MKDISYQQLLKFDLQTQGQRVIHAPVADDAMYRNELAAQQIDFNLIWSSEKEMVHDFDKILENPLVVHWVRESVGLNLNAVRLSYNQKKHFYKEQANFFIQALVLLVRDETKKLSRENFNLVKEELNRRTPDSTFSVHPPLMNRNFY